jgi:hypothetical protein
VQLSKVKILFFTAVASVGFNILAVLDSSGDGPQTPPPIVRLHNLVCWSERGVGILLSIVCVYLAVSLLVKKSSKSGESATEHAKAK